MGKRSERNARRSGVYDKNSTGRTYYNYTSEAYKFYEGTESIYGRRSGSRKKLKKGSHSKLRSKERAARRKNAKTPQYELLLNENPGHSLRIYFTIALFFMLSFCVIHEFAAAAQANLEKARLSEDIKNITDEIKYIESELNNSIDDERIKNEAMEKFGMHEPFDYQIVHIEVPVTNKSYQYASEPAIEKVTIDKGLFMEAIGRIGIGD